MLLTVSVWAGTASLVLIGAILNVIVRIANSGKIPVSFDEKLYEPLHGRFGFGRTLMTEDTNLNFLGDRFLFYCTTPFKESFLSYTCATSIGDFIMTIGLVGCLFLTPLMIFVMITTKVE